MDQAVRPLPPKKLIIFVGLTLNPLFFHCTVICNCNCLNFFICLVFAWLVALEIMFWIGYRNVLIGVKSKQRKRRVIMLYEYFRKIIKYLFVLCRTIRNDEEIPKCAENKK